MTNCSCYVRIPLCSLFRSGIVPLYHQATSIRMCIGFQLRNGRVCSTLTLSLARLALTALSDSYSANHRSFPYRSTNKNNRLYISFAASYFAILSNRRDGK